MSAPVDVYVVAGEASGDLHAGNLVRALRARKPGLRARGLGGPRLAQAGCEVSIDLTEFAVMGIIRVLPLLGRFIDVVNVFRAELLAYKPKAVVLIDYPGLNFILARLARGLGIPVVYYCCPQLWAWAPWRVKKLQRCANLLLVIFPFEEACFRGGAAAVKYVGHPMCDELAGIDCAAARREVRAQCGVADTETLVGIFPGSRRQEVAGLAAPMAAAARVLGERHANVKFAFSCFKEKYAPLYPAGVPVVMGPGERLMAACDCAAVASGTASLELAYFRKPMTVVYPLSRWKQRLFAAIATTPFISTVNVLAGKEIVGEHFLARPGDLDAVIEELSRFLSDKGAYAACVRALGEVAGECLQPGASARAAAEILALIDAPRPQVNVE
jgi:lipid-A-disaccharide synthase